MNFDASHPFSQAFEYASDQIGLRFQNPLYQITEFFRGSKLRSSLREVKHFGQTIVKSARKRQSQTAFKSLFTKNEPIFDTLIDSLMATFSYNPEIVADAALNFLSAGRDTTAQSLTWTFYLIMRHQSQIDSFLKPDLQNLQDDNRHDSKHQNVQPPPKSKQKPTSTNTINVPSLQPTHIPHLTALFYESLRLYPPVPFELKQCTKDITLPDGTFLPKGAIVLWCIWAMNRSRSRWGVDAETFRPGRWLERIPTSDSDPEKDQRSAGEVHFVPKTAYEFPVFNGGPRSCLGKRMAELMAVWVIARMLGEFVFEESFDHDTNTALGGEKERNVRISQNSLTLPMKDGLPCYVRLRTE